MGLLFSCALTKRQLVKYSHLQNGKKIYVTTCNGAYYTIATCHQRASKACNGKYATAGQETFQTSDYTTTQYDDLTRATISNSTQNIGRTFMFSCIDGEANLNPEAQKKQ